MLAIKVQWLNTGGIVIQSEGYTDSLESLIGHEIPDDNNLDPIDLDQDKEFQK